MSAPKTEIQGPVLEWALKDAGLDRSDVLSQAGLTDVALSGPVQINVEVLTYLASVTHRSPYFFALPAPPSDDKSSVNVNFRAPMSSLGVPRALNPSERAALREAKRRQHMAAKLSAELEHDLVKLPKIGDRETPEAAAKRITGWLGWGTLQERRKKIKSKSQLFVALRDRLEDHGILTNVAAVDSDSFRGFSLHHPRVPLVFVNGAVKSPSARSFTLLHELAHLLRGVDKACDTQDLQSRTSDEAWCNRFAAAVLMPENDLRTYLEKHLKAAYVRDTESVRRISNYFHCSWYSVAIRLKQLDLADESLVTAVSGSFQDPDPDGFLPGGQRRPMKRMALYGQNFGRLLDAALSASLVSEIEVRKTLRLETGSELRNFLELARRSA